MCTFSLSNGLKPDSTRRSKQYCRERFPNSFFTFQQKFFSRKYDTAEIMRYFFIRKQTKLGCKHCCRPPTWHRLWMLLLSVALLLRLLPQFLQRHSASSSSSSHCSPNCTISTARPIVAPCPPSSCPRPTLVLCERLVRPGLQNGVRRKPVFIPRAENENPKICGYNFSQWATYKGAPVLTSPQRRDWVGSDKVGEGQTTLEERQKKVAVFVQFVTVWCDLFPPENPSKSK